MTTESTSTLRAQVSALREQIKAEKAARAASDLAAAEEVSRERLLAERESLKAELAAVMGKPVDQVQMPEVVLVEEAAPPVPAEVAAAIEADASAAADDTKSAGKR